jgi:hypothetical protein
MTPFMGETTTNNNNNNNTAYNSFCQTNMNEVTTKIRIW